MSWRDIFFNQTWKNDINTLNTETSLDTNNLKNQRMPPYRAIDDNQSPQGFNLSEHQFGPSIQGRPKGQKKQQFKEIIDGKMVHHVGCPQKILTVGKKWKKQNFWGILSGVGFFPSTVSCHLNFHKIKKTAVLSHNSEVGSKCDANGIFSTHWNHWHTQLPEIWSPKHDSSIDSHLLLNDLNGNPPKLKSAVLKCRNLGQDPQDQQVPPSTSQHFKNASNITFFFLDVSTAPL